MYINLIDKEDKSGIKYAHSQFPDGQQQISLDYSGYLPNNDGVVIHARLNNFMDLEKIICANQSLREAGYTSISLYVPYFLGSRSDRKFSNWSNNYLKTVICPIINSQNFDEVQVLDPHSDVLEACLNNYSKKANFDLVKFALTKIDNKDNAQDRIILISPDGGALKKIYDVAEVFSITNIVTAMKHRDIKTGRITHTEVPISEETRYYEDCKFVIVDDICDGGRTFVELAKAIKAIVPVAKIYLIVSHGIFSQGISPLADHFEAIFCTNSYKEISETSEDTDLERAAKQKVFQYNVFPATVTKNESVLR
jgi:ribose-phosphate pyrophosphokinase